ncbi:MAG: transporter substrate-binding domain-containing protein [Candidatus Delongbacteria bacterium]|nr:transporter substrate-binding domain-containing protein [Candidatus Delongbacteria bacterium]
MNLKNIKYTSVIILLLFNTVLELFAHKVNVTKFQSASEYNYPPFCIVNEDSTAGGFSVELLKASCEAMGIGIDFKIGEWNIIKDELAEGKIDILPLVGRTPERENIYDFTFPYISFHGAVFARKDEQSIENLGDLKDKVVMVLKGDNAEEYAKRVKLSSNLKTTSTYEDAFLSLEKGKCDAVVAQKLMGLKIIKNQRLKNIAPLDLILNEFKQDFCFAVKEGDKEHLATINEGLSIVIANGTFNKLYEKWFSPKIKYQRTKLVIGGDYNYPPYEFLNEKGEPTGYNVDLIRTISKDLGILIEVKLGVWSDIKNELLNGEIDAILGMYYTKDRDIDFDFSTPHTVIDHVIINRAGSEQFDNIMQLKGKQIVVMKDDVMHDYLLSNGFDNEINAVKSQQEALLNLSNGNYDCALIAKTPALYYIEKDKLKNLIINDHTYLSQQYCFATIEGNDALTTILSEALANLKASGEYGKIYSKWFQSYEKSAINYTQILKYSIVISIPLFIVIIVIVFWNRSLQSQVNRKTKDLYHEIDERKNVENELKILNENLEKRVKDRTEEIENIAKTLQEKKSKLEKAQDAMRFLVEDVNSSREELATVNKKLLSANKELEAFTYSVSHDLRAPLRLIIGYSNIYIEDYGDSLGADEKNVINTITRNTQKMQQLIDDLLKYSRIGKADINIANIDTIKKFENKFDECSKIDESRKINFNIAETLPNIKADKILFTQLVHNLICNSIKYTNKEKVAEINIGFTEDNDTLTIFIEDNGVGFDEKYKHKLFEVFQRLHSDEEFQGTGIGLSIVAKVAQKHGWTVDAESTINEGAKFYIRIPNRHLDTITS